MTPTRPLDPIEVRVLGALLEKQQTTPDAYPLTNNQVIAAANQKSNREPVLSLTETQVVEALDRLAADVLTWRSTGARAERWEHRLDRRWHLDAARKSIMTLLMLRGPQTPGELRARSGRMHSFGGVDDVERVLQGLATGPEPLVRELSRRPGQRECRWMHLVGDEDPAAIDAAQAARAPAEAPRPAAGRLAERVDQLEAHFAALEARLARLEAG